MVRQAHHEWLRTSITLSLMIVIMKDQRPLLPIFFYLITFILFFIDLAALSLFEKPLIYSLLCFYILSLSKPISILRILLTCLLLSINPLISYGRFGLELVYLIPATLLGIKMHHTLYNAVWQYYLLLMLCLLAQIVIIEYGMLHLTISVPYTISVLFANIGLIWIMSYGKY